MKKLILLFTLVAFSLGNILFSNSRQTKELEIYNNSIESVFTIFGDAGHGSGFLIDDINGLILTNRHVVQNSLYIRVQLNDSLKVEGTLLTKDFHKDIAVLQINPIFTKNIKILPLASQEYDLYIGEKVFAIGSPLNQTGAITSGIISKLEEHVILSDVNINPGNSGGPLFNSEGVVIGINTFGDITNRGPGLSGIIKITGAINLIESAKLKLDSNITLPSKKPLPIMPSSIFPLEGLKEAVHKKYSSNYYSVSRGGFYINITSPPYRYYRTKKDELRMLEEREKLENKSNITSFTEEILFDDLFSWRSNLGAYKPVVRIEVFPKIAPSFGSILLGVAIVGASGGILPLMVEEDFRGDLYDFKLFKNDTLVLDLERSVALGSFSFLTGTATTISYGSDMAQYGIFQYPIELFRPNNEEWPNIRLEIYDLKKGIKKPTIIKLKKSSIAQIWEDFIPYTGDTLSIDLIEKQKKPNTPPKFVMPK